MINLKIDDEKKNLGRPCLLTREEILERALEVGFDNLTMAGLAEVLDVSTGTIYRYFPGKAELSRAIAAHAMTKLVLPDDSKLHWSIVLRGYVEVIYKSLVENPSFIINSENIEFGYDVKLEFAENFLRAMTSRGMEEGFAVDLLHIIQMIGVAGAVERIRQRHKDVDESEFSKSLQKLLSSPKGTSFPFLQIHSKRFARTARQRMDLMMRFAYDLAAEELGEEIANYPKIRTKIYSKKK